MRYKLFDVYNLPIVVIVAWWLGCLALFSFDWPIDYVGTNRNLVVSLTLASLLLSVLGFSIGSRKPSWVTPKPIPPSRAANLGIISSLVLFPILVSTYSGYSVADFSVALQNQDTAYQLASRRIDAGFSSRSVAVALRALLAPLTLLALPYFCLKWFEERIKGLQCLMLLSTSAVYSVLVGRDQQLGAAVLTIAATWTLSRARRMRPLELRTLVFPTFGLALGMVLFSLRKTARASGSFQCSPGAETCQGKNEGLFRSAFEVFASYASQGFEGLGRAMQGEWRFGGGISHSPPLRSIFGGDIPFSGTP